MGWDGLVLGVMCYVLIEVDGEDLCVIYPNLRKKVFSFYVLYLVSLCYCNSHVNVLCNFDLSCTVIEYK